MNIKLPRPRLVDDWKQAKGWWTIHVQTVGFLFSVVKAGIVAASAVTGWFHILPSFVCWCLVATLFLLGAIVRILKQPGDP